MVLECLPILEELAPETSARGLSIEALLHAPTYHLEIAKSASTGEIEILGGDRVDEGVAYYLLPAPNTSARTEK